MAIYFDRVCKVEIEGSHVITTEQLKIKFEITKSIQSRDNTGKIEIYNLAPETRSRINAEQSIVKIWAGYSNYKGLIEMGQGDITRVNTNRGETEAVTEIYIAEGLKKIRSSPMSISYASNVELNDILNRLSAESGFTFRQVDMDSSKTMAGGYADMGSLDTILDNLAITYNFDWSVQNGVILIKGRRPSDRNEIMLFTPDTGLILSPESVKKISRRIEKSKIVKEEKGRYTAQVLLQPQLQINDIVAIQSQDLNGKFRVEKITHRGDTHGSEWYSDLEVSYI